MKLSAALKAFALTKGWAAEDATDDVVSKAVVEKLASDELDPATLHKLQTEAPGDNAKKAIQAMVSDAMAPVLEQIKALQAGITEKGSGTTTTPAPAPAPAFDAAGVQAIIDKGIEAGLQKAGIGGDGGSPNPVDIFRKAYGQAGFLKGGSAEVKKAVERYDGSRSAAHWGTDCKHASLRGKRLTAPSLAGPGMGRGLDLPSRADEAVSGAFFKWSLATNSNPHEVPGWLKMTDHDWELVRYALHELPWTGTVNNDSTAVDGCKLTDVTRKALLDDSTSGGITMVPQVFDDAVIMTPLLLGELFPLVSVIDIVAGRRIEAATMGRPTFTSGIAESTAIPLFDTTGFIGALDFTVTNAVAGMEIGNDFQQDTPVANVGQMIIEAYGQAALAWLDMVIAVGDGTTQPKGIFNTAGTTVVASSGGPGGPVSMGDLEGTLYGVNKAFRTSRGGGRNVYIGNETSYRRFKQLPVAATYNTRVLGTDYNDYSALGFPFRVQQNVTNSQLAFVNMAYYRMYRRLGNQFKVETRGKELTLRNVTLITARMRYAGQLTLGAAAGVMLDLQA